MSLEAENKVKIRIKLRSGEEFEAEGSPEFIEKQRADFLNLIGKQEGRNSRVRPISAELHTTAPTLPSQQHYTPSEILPTAPAAFRRGQGTLSTEQGTLFTNPQETPKQSDLSEKLRLWEELCKTEDDLVILRRKSRLLGAETAALLLIAAAKALLGANEGFGALSLSKALAKSGYGGNRLDRVLAGEIKRGTIKSFGSKRSRSYSLTDEGFAKAFVLAGKVLEDWR